MFYRFFCFLFAALLFTGCLSPDSSDTDSSGGNNSDIDNGDGEEPVPEPEPLPPDPNDTCDATTPGVPAGLACIHCLHTNARTQAAVLAQAMRDSCRDGLITNFLINGRFGNDDAFLTEFIRALGAGRHLNVVFYISNGATQRRNDPARPGEFDSGMSIATFRDRIVNDPGLREQYKQVVQRMMAIRSQFPENFQFTFVPALEDNFTDDIFDNVLALTREVAGDEVSYARNPCPDCAEGNGIRVPTGVISQVHGASPILLPTNGIMSNDGFAYRFEFQSGDGLSIGDLNSLKNAAFGQNTRFILWTPEYQGLPVRDGQLSGRPDPDVRVYAVPSPQEYAELVTFMK